MISMSFVVLIVQIKYNYLRYGHKISFWPVRYEPLCNMLYSFHAEQLLQRGSNLGASKNLFHNKKTVTLGDILLALI